MAVYDSGKEVFFVRTWRCAGESITMKMKTDSATANSLFFDQKTIQAMGDANTVLSYLGDRRNYTDGVMANVSALPSVSELPGTSYESAWKFAVVRNPYAIVYSEWKIINKTYNRVKNAFGQDRADNLPGPEDMEVSKFRTIVNDFNEYVTFKFGQDNNDKTEITGICTKGIAGCLYHANGALGVDEVLYHEDLNNEWNSKVAVPKGYSNNVSVVINRINNSEITGPQANQSWQTAYTNTSINLVANAYCADLSLFGYSFSDGDNKPTGHTIPTTAVTKPYGPWQGRSTPGRRFSSNGGEGFLKAVDNYMVNKIKLLIANYIRLNS